MGASKQNTAVAAHAHAILQKRLFSSPALVRLAPIQPRCVTLQPLPDTVTDYDCRLQCCGVAWSRSGCELVLIGQPHLAHRIPISSHIGRTKTQTSPIPCRHAEAEFSAFSSVPFRASFRTLHCHCYLFFGRAVNSWLGANVRVLACRLGLNNITGCALRD